jgi:cytochrome c-type biogenesis protein CcmH
MLSFWIFAGLMVAMALLYVLPPLLQRSEKKINETDRSNVSIYRDQLMELDGDLRDGVLDKEQYEQGRLELQRRLLEDVTPSQGTGGDASPARNEKTTAIMLGVAIPFLAVLLYFQLGTPQSFSPEQPSAQLRRERESGMPPPSAGQPGAPTQQEIEGRVAKLAERLKENPNDAQGWAMLARSYQSFNRYKEASEAYARAAALVGNDAQLWVDYAETLALSNDSRLQGQPLELINKALQLDPDNQKALWLAGNAAYQAEDFQRAISYWEKLAKQLPPGSQGAQAVATTIEDARARMK